MNKEKLLFWGGVVLLVVLPVVSFITGIVFLAIASNNIEKIKTESQKNNGATGETGPYNCNATGAECKNSGSCITKFPAALPESTKCESDANCKSNEKCYNKKCMNPIYKCECKEEDDGGYDCSLKLDIKLYKDYRTAGIIMIMPAVVIILIFFIHAIYKTFTNKQLSKNQ